MKKRTQPLAFVCLAIALLGSALSDGEQPRKASKEHGKLGLRCWLDKEGKSMVFEISNRSDHGIMLRIPTERETPSYVVSKRGTDELIFSSTARILGEWEERYHWVDVPRFEQAKGLMSGRHVFRWHQPLPDGALIESDYAVEVLVPLTYRIITQRDRHLTIEDRYAVHDCKFVASGEQKKSGR